MTGPRTGHSGYGQSAAHALQSIVSPQDRDQKRGCTATDIENARWRPKSYDVASEAATEELLPQSTEYLAKLAVLNHRDDLKLHEVAPHERELRERLDVIAFKQVETAAEIRSRPSAEQFGTFRGSSAGCLESPNRLVAFSGFKEKVSMNFIVLFPMSLHGPGLPEPCAQVRASSHVGCILGATREREPREGTQRGLFLERGAATRSQTWRS